MYLHNSVPKSVLFAATPVIIAIDGAIMTEVLWGMGSGQVHLPFIV
jgi:hypothetical protein